MIYAISEKCPQRQKICPLFLFTIIDGWNADVMGGDSAVILDHKDKGHTIGMVEQKLEGA